MNNVMKARLLFFFTMIVFGWGALATAAAQIPTADSTLRTISTSAARMRSDVFRSSVTIQELAW